MQKIIMSINCKYFVYLTVSPSFVVGSDGYIYEGRGWMSQGAHTKGHNTVGYGVAFIGNYTAHLPTQFDMELVHHHLVKCGVSNGFLHENFTILGHRQVVAGTTCPGESLYSEITTWEHYKVCRMLYLDISKFNAGNTCHPNRYITLWLYHVVHRIRILLRNNEDICCHWNDMTYGAWLL